MSVEPDDTCGAPEAGAFFCCRMLPSHRLQCMKDTALVSLWV